MPGWKRLIYLNLLPKGRMPPFLNGVCWRFRVLRSEQSRTAGYRSMPLSLTHFSAAPERATVSCAIEVLVLEAVVASQPSPSPSQQQGSPYCSDPHCQSCKELREVQEAIRLHLPLPQKKA